MKLINYHHKIIISSLGNQHWFNRIVKFLYNRSLSFAISANPKKPFAKRFLYQVVNADVRLNLLSDYDRIYIEVE